MTERYEKKEKKAQRQGEKWIAEEDNKLKEEFYSGMSVAEIAKTHKRTMGGISARLEKLKLIDKP